MKGQVVLQDHDDIGVALQKLRQQAEMGCVAANLPVLQRRDPRAVFIVIFPLPTLGDRRAEIGIEPGECQPDRRQAVAGKASRSASFSKLTT